MTREELRRDYEAALQRAEARGVDVSAVGYGQDGTRYWFVPSATDPDGDWHRVWVSDGRFNCTCEGGSHGKLCMHKAVARRQYIAEERQEQPEPQAPPTRVSRPMAYDGRRKNNTCVGCGARFEVGEDLVLSDQGAYHYPMCAPTTTHDAPGTGAVRRTQAFSILK